RLSYLPFILSCVAAPPHLHSFPTRRSSDLAYRRRGGHAKPAAGILGGIGVQHRLFDVLHGNQAGAAIIVVHHQKLFDAALVKDRSEEHTSELQSRENLVCRLLLEKKKLNVE